jgi:hypothetical protein
MVTKPTASEYRDEINRLKLRGDERWAVLAIEVFTVRAMDASQEEALLDCLNEQRAVTMFDKRGALGNVEYQSLGDAQ